MAKQKIQQQFEYLRSELEAMQVPVELPESKANIILEEISYALSPPVHEQKYPCYGAIVCDGFEKWGDDAFTFILNVEETTLPSLRIYADGNRSFIMRIDNTSLIVALSPPSSAQEEIDAVKMIRRLKNGLLIQKLKSGVLRLVNHEIIIEHKERRWLSKITSHNYYYIVQAYAQSYIDQPNTSLADNLLDLCIHRLSPLKIGATIVWLFDKLSRDIYKGLGKGEIAPEMTLSRITYPMLLSALSQLDRALVIDYNGSVKEVGVTLISSKESEKKIPKLGGTRHTTAKRFSFDNPNSLVFVVSEDGPVSVFGNGETIVKSSTDILR